MKGLATSRILVIDDKLTEAAPMLTSLAHNGIAASYYSVQTRGEYPKVPLSGIRLAFLDLELKGNGAPDIKDTAGRFLKCITPENGPYVLVTWTKHSEEHTNVITQICEYEPKLRPICSFPINKYKEDGEPYSFEDLLPVFEKKMEQLKPIEFFTRWEARLHQCATITTNNILGSIPKELPKDEIEEQASKIVGALAGASLGKVDRNSLNGKSIIQAATSTLLPVLGDVFEREGIIEDADFESDLAKTCSTFCSSHEQAAPFLSINSALILGTPLEDNVPGTAYAYCEDTTSLFSDLLNGISTEDAEQKLEADETPKQAKKRLNKIFKDQLRYIGVELSNACDYAQQKKRFHRFVGGIIVPATYQEQIKKFPYVKVIGPFLFDGTPSFLCLSSRHIYSKPLTEENGDKLLQLRNQVVVDAQAWLSSYIQRPGMLTIPFN